MLKNALFLLKNRKIRRALGALTLGPLPPAAASLRLDPQPTSPPDPHWSPAAEGSAPH